MVTPLVKPSVVISGIACSWFLVRLLIEPFVPFVPYVTDNSLIRIAAEMPFYMVAEWECGMVDDMVGAEWLHNHWGMTVATAIIETIVVGCISLVGFGVIRYCCPCSPKKKKGTL